MSAHSIPPLRLHKQTKQGRVWLDGKEHYCGVYGTPDCTARYHELIAEWLKGGGVSGIFSVRKLKKLYLEHVTTLYPPGKSGQTEATNIGCALANLTEDQLDKHPDRFKPMDLLETRQAMVDKGRKHKPINRDIRRIVAMFAHGTVIGKVNAATLVALKAVPTLRNNSRPVGPIPEDVLGPMLDAMSERCGDICRVMLHTGMRVGEVLSMRWQDIDRSESVWRYVLSDHKTVNVTGERRVWIGPKAQRVLMKYGDRPAGEPIFVTVHQGSAYKPKSVWSSMQRAVEKLPTDLVKGRKFHPHQLRHNAATTVADIYGKAYAQDVLGHTNVATTGIYTREADERRRRVAAEHG